MKAVVCSRSRQSKKLADFAVQLGFSTVSTKAQRGTLPLTWPMIAGPVCRGLAAEVLKLTYATFIHV
jgi:rhodanese-related sulfurtransferase